jgi:hypothetical protein
MPFPTQLNSFNVVNTCLTLSSKDTIDATYEKRSIWKKYKHATLQMIGRYCVYDSPDIAAVMAKVDKKIGHCYHSAGL